MNIQEVSDILGCCRPMIVPQHVFITPEEVCDELSGACYRGMQPKRKRGIIFLSAQADGSTPAHEAWHSATGLGEVTAYPFGAFIKRKHEFLSKHPRLKDLASRKVKYRGATKKETEAMFPDALKYGDRVQHYVLA